MVGSKQEILTYLKTQKNLLREKYHVRRVAVIGSFARDEQSATSDIDLLLDLEGTANIFEIKRTLKKQFEQNLGRPVEFASERYLKPYYKAEILREAIYI
jgi:predicted nucleotidyltransferase